MYLRKGSYTHQLDEATIAITSDVQRDADDLPEKVIHRWAIRGQLHGDDTNAIITAMRALEAAYASDGDSVYILKDDQTTVVHQLLNSAMDGGVRIARRPSYPIGDGAELSTFRTYDIIVEAEEPFAERMGSILSYTERLEIIGGGPEYKLLTLRNGPPQLQKISQATPFYASQSGSAVGYNAWPSMPPPYWPEPIFNRPVSRTSHDLPVAKGNPPRRVFREWPISWNYQFQSASPLVRQPERAY